MSTPHKTDRRMGKAPMSSAGEPATTLRLARAELDALREQMDSDGSGGEGSIQREFKRWPFDRTPVKMEVTHPGGAVTTLAYACRNLSRGGIGLLHGSFVHEGSRCVVMLPHPERGEIKVPGKVVRVRHVRGKVHEIGVKFDRPIDVRRILRLDPSAGGFVLEKVNPQALRGSLLFVEASEMDRSLIRHYLSDTNLDITPATSGAEALERAKDGPDLVLSELDLGDMTGIDLLKRLREEGVSAPFIMLSADTAATQRCVGANVRPDILLVKPVSGELLLSVLGEILLLEGLAGSGSGALMTTLAQGDPLTAQVPAFLAEAKRVADQLVQAIASKDGVAARKLAAQVRSAATPLGFAVLGQLAGSALVSLAVTPDTRVEDAEQDLRMLIAGLRRVRPRAEAA